MTTSEAIAFEATFNRYYHLVYQLAFRCVGQADEAEDIAQEVFLRFYNTPPTTTNEAGQRAWLCRVATNLGLNVLRSRKRRTTREEEIGVTAYREAELSAAEQDPEYLMLVDEQNSQVRTLLAALPERQQTLLLLRSIGLSYAEIAQAANISITSVGPLLTRAMRDFRRKYHERTLAIEAK